MALPPNMDWQNTKNGLHQAAQVVSAFRKATIDPLPNHLHHSLTPTQNGVRTGAMKNLEEFSLNYPALTITYTRNKSEAFSIDLAGHSQSSLFEAISAQLQDHNNEGIAPQKPDFATDEFILNADHATAFASMNWQMFEAIAITKAHFFGGQTPIVLWSHGFDLSTIWFAEGMDEAKDPHINIGFSPGTTDHPEPYLYFYAYPVQPEIHDNLPEIVTWNSNWGTPGGMVPYSRLLEQDDPTAAVEAVLLHIYHIGKRIMGG